jgi:transcriptional regulator with XRE-family HTH domain
MTLAKRIRERRYAKGWGPDELASRASISRTALYQIECGKTETPRAGTLRRIAEALGVSIENLLGNLEWDRSVQNGDGDARESRSVKFLGAEALAFETDEGSSAPSDTEGLIDSSVYTTRGLTSMQRDVERKFRELMASPLGDCLARIIEESHRLIPRMPERAAQ